ncbi:MAG: hypothetical protein LAN64_18110 [Acidobacteriia bacterium]|nr:hypothetical protein [Terriglobia bacterium]
MVTLVEGALRVIRGTTVLRGGEGMPIRQGDIIESADPGFAQLEFTGGPIVALGPSSRLFLFSHRAGRSLVKSEGEPAETELVLLSGWLKGESDPNAGACRYSTPLLAATSRGGSVLLHAAAATEIFVESGSVAIGMVNRDGNLGQSSAAKAGQFFSRRPGRTVNSASRLDPGFVDALPRAFRDTLPSRLPHFAGKRPTEPRRDHEVTYPEIQPWLTMAHAWRRGFVERFQPRLSDPEFRKGVEAHLNEHPEWDRILHPEKYQPKAAPPAATPDSRHGRE